LEAKTLGYVGLGFNSARTMKGADLVVAWVNDRNGNAQVLVSYSAKPKHLVFCSHKQLGWACLYFLCRLLVKEIRLF
jgi:hypothetical protein